MTSEMGGNAAVMRRSNLLAIARSLRTAPTRTRSELSRDTGLSEPTVYRLVEELVRLGLARPVAARKTPATGRGRPIVPYRFASDSGCLVGIDIGGTTVRLVLSDLDGLVVESLQVQTSDVAGNLVAGLHSAIDLLTTKANAARIVAIGVGAPSVVSSGGVLLRPWLQSNWTGLPLSAQLSERLGCAVFVQQDNHLAARAEISPLGTAPGSTSVVVVELGSGIGAGAVLHGWIQYGGQGGFGRLMKWPCDPPEGFEHLGITLGECLTGDGLVRQLRARDSRTRATNAAELFEAATLGDPAATETVSWAAMTLNDVLRRVSLLLDPDHLIIGGSVGRALARDRENLVGEDVAATVNASVLEDMAVAFGGLLIAADHVEHWLAACLFYGDQR